MATVIAMEPLVNAYKNAVQGNYANFSGRLSVGGYWWFFLANIIVSIVLYVLSQVSGIFVLLYFIYSLALIIPGLAAAIRRLHDTGKSGWFILLGLIPIVGVIILIVFLASSGEPNQNAYGPPPPPIS